jgi:hypothetical protein
MSARVLPGAAATRRRRRTPPQTAGDTVFDLDRARIERALQRRQRYKYVQPRVEREGLGWKIVSANCSRNIDPQGGDIDIAWFEPDGGAGWLLHARKHAENRWLLMAGPLPLPAALEQVNADPHRVYWP